MPYPTSLSRLRAAALYAGVATLSPLVSRAGTLALNFGGDGYGAFGQSVTADAYGVPVADWSPLLGSADLEPDVTATATVSGVTVTWTAANDWAQPGTFAGPPGAAEVNFGYLDDGNGGAAISLTGLSAWLAASGETTYSVRVVNSTDNGNSFSPASVYATNGGALLGTLTNLTSWSAGANAGISSTLSGLSGDTLFIHGGDGVGGQARGGIAAILITPGAVPNLEDYLVPIPAITTYVMGDAAEGDGSIANVVNGSGLSRPDPLSPASWTHDNTWQHGWQGRGDLTLLSGNVGWVVLDLQKVVPGLSALYLWNVNENAGYRLATGVETFEIYAATSIDVPPPATGPVFQDYSFTSGGWTNVAGVRTATIGTGSDAGPVNATVNLGGITARYIGLKFLTNYNSTVPDNVIPGTGLAEIVLTKIPGTRPPPVDFRITGVTYAPATSTLTLEWLSEAGATYTVERATDPAGTWAPVNSAVSSTGALTQYADATVPSGSPRYFYRIRKNP